MAAASAEQPALSCSRRLCAEAAQRRAWHPSVAGIVLLYCAVAMFSFVLFKRRRWSRSRKLAEKYLGHARLLVQSQEPADVYAAVGLLDGALKLHPNWEKALELKARCLLSLRRFREVANLLYEYIPSFKYEDNTPPDSPLAEKVKLLSDYLPDKVRRKSVLRYLSFARIKKRLLTKRTEREEWRFLVLGQACCHLGMMEDAMILLQSGKRAASAASRKESNDLNEDSFCYEGSVGPSEADLVNHLLGNIKFLLRRRAAAIAAMDAGLYTEAVRHFSKILDGRRGTPQGFIAECYLHRAVAYQAAGRIPDAIADCNRTLALDPVCVEALGTRAALYEMVRCFYECFQDLEQLKLLYEAILRHRKFPGAVWRLTQNAEEVDVHGNYEAVNMKIAEIRHRLEHGYTIDYHSIIGVSHHCMRSEVERAHLLICLKHRPDKAAHFVDRCEFVDDRDIEAVKEEARLAAIKLFCLIQRAHSGIIGVLLDEEEAHREKMGNEVEGLPWDGRYVESETRGGPGGDSRWVESDPRGGSGGSLQLLVLDAQRDKENKSAISQPVSRSLQVSKPLAVSNKMQGSHPATLLRKQDDVREKELLHHKSPPIETPCDDKDGELEAETEDTRSPSASGANSSSLSVGSGHPLGCGDVTASTSLPFGLGELTASPQADGESEGTCMEETSVSGGLLVTPQLENYSSFSREVQEPSQSCETEKAECLNCNGSSANSDVSRPATVCSEDAVTQADATSSVGGVTCRELAAVGAKLSNSLAPSTWMTSNENWHYQGYGTISLQVT